MRDHVEGLVGSEDVYKRQELLWVFGLNKADAVWEWAIIICLIPIDFYFLMKACEKLPTGTV
ncbi:hypothetical protein ACQ4LK_25670, partial [Bacillus pumilus]